MGIQGVRGLTVGVLMLLGSSCASFGLPERADNRPSLELGSLGEMTNVRLCGDTWLGGSPGVDDLDLAIRRGVTMVLDLSEGTARELRGGGADPSVICARKGVSYRHVAFDAQYPSEAAVDTALRALAEADGETRLLYCKSGNNIGLLFAIWRAVEHGMDVEAALAEGRRVGMKPGPQEHAVRSHVARLRARKLARRVGIDTAAMSRES